MTFMRRGQTILEYTMIIGILTMVLYYMGTGIKRGVKSLVKVTADQVGTQQNADQDFNDVQQGYMVASNSQVQETRDKLTSEVGYIPNASNAVFSTNTSYNDSTYTISNTTTNGGFSQNN